MSVRSGQSITVLFTTRVFSTGVGTNADSLPTGALYVNGTVNAASVTVTNISTGLYNAAVTLPTLAFGDEVEIIIAATVSTIADTAVIWGDTKDLAVDTNGIVQGDLQTIKTEAITCAAPVTILASVGTAATSTAQTGDAYAIVTNGTYGNSAIQSTMATSVQVAAVTTNVEAHGDTAWATATGFATPTNVTDAAAAVVLHGDGAWDTATGFAVPGSKMTLDMAQAVNPTVTTETVGGALNAARVQGFGKWVEDKDAKTLTLYAADGITVVRTFTLNDSTSSTAFNPTSRV